MLQYINKCKGVMLMLTADNNLIKKWNNFFGYNCIENFSGNTYDDLFNS